MLAMLSACPYLSGPRPFFALLLFGNVTFLRGERTLSLLPFHSPTSRPFCVLSAFQDTCRLNSSREKHKIRKKGCCTVGSIMSCSRKLLLHSKQNEIASYSYCATDAHYSPSPIHSLFLFYSVVVYEYVHIGYSLYTYKAFEQVPMGGACND